MIKILLIIIALLLVMPAQSDAQFWKNLKKEAKKLVKDKDIGDFSAEEAAAGIREALIKGTKKGTDLVSKVDGYYKNPEIMIPFPKDAKKVDRTLRKIGLGKEVDKAVKSINQAAEMAAAEAKDIFVDAITDMTLDDALNIVKGDTSAATTYLKKNTTSSLTERFTPIIKAALDKTNATKYWKSIFKTYNKNPFAKKVNTDLTSYVTEMALGGLFTMIQKEEGLIRRDPVARTTDLLKKIFGEG
ncbi:MAG: DUF4197 domain-containing protein [Chlorobi bacterium]|nr:DUF4197 domain-containing protein [Chlorobiota bacterium]